MVNMYYQPADKADVENTYQYYLAMNHHNIKETKDTEYYQRCVERFRQLIVSPDKKIYLHILPLCTKTKYEENSAKWVDECVEFNQFLYEYSKQTTQGIFIILARENNTSFRYELLYHNPENNTKIFVFYTNRRFIDAGETFMGECHQEMNQIMRIIESSMIPK
jgi:hypothetical protein